ncbi:hypothetical protein EIQ30_09290 [Xanthomonas campestris]
MTVLRAEQGCMQRTLGGCAMLALPKLRLKKAALWSEAEWVMPILRPTVRATLPSPRQKGLLRCEMRSAAACAVTQSPQGRGRQRPAAAKAGAAAIAGIGAVTPRQRASAQAAAVRPATMAGL